MRKPKKRTTALVPVRTETTDAKLRTKHDDAWSRRSYLRHDDGRELGRLNLEPLVLERLLGHLGRLLRHSAAQSLAQEVRRAQRQAERERRDRALAHLVDAEQRRHLLGHAQLDVVVELRRARPLGGLVARAAARESTRRRGARRGRRRRAAEEEPGAAARARSAAAAARRRERGAGAAR
jgi:hypothetical protein